MQIRKIAYAAFVGVAAVAFVIGSAVPSEAAKKKKCRGRSTTCRDGAMANVLGRSVWAGLREKGQPDVQLHQCLLCHEGRRFRRQSWRLQASKGWRKEESLNYLANANGRAAACSGPFLFLAFLA